ncbi:MAG: pilin [Burkholderiaceae bacterium]|nr:pilin [Burkholderiaceae bacterium]
MAEGLTLAGGAKASITEFRASMGHWPATQESAGLMSANSISGNAVTSVEVTGGTGEVIITFNDKVQTGLTLIMTPSVGDGGSIKWTCNGSWGNNGTVPAKWRPANCRS